MCQQEKSRKKNGPFAHDTSVAVAPSSQLMLGAYNSGHTATLRSTQIVPFGNDFVCQRPLGETTSISLLKAQKHILIKEVRR